MTLAPAQRAGANVFWRRGRLVSGSQRAVLLPCLTVRSDRPGWERQELDSVQRTHVV